MPDNLGELLDRIGWTTGELAERLQVSPDTTGQWRRGRRSPPPSVLVWLTEVAVAVETAGAMPPGWIEPPHGE